MEKIAFTLCSNNYLAQAKTLADSLLKHNPDYAFYIGLVDKMAANVDYERFSPSKIIPIDTIGIVDFDKLWKKYNIIEFNTAVKASFFKYLFKSYPATDSVLYFDPDITIFDSLSTIENDFSESDILITPHILKPIPPDNKIPNENSFLNFGVYNMGFVGVKNNFNGSQFLLWWEERLRKLCYMDVANGIYVDQLLINLVPIFFRKVKILTHLGFNVAPWNLHERISKQSDGFFQMVDNSSLTFYHFSGYNYLQPLKMSKYNRSDFNNCPSVLSFYNEYHSNLLNNGIEEFSKIKCFYADKKFYKLKKKINKALKLILPPILVDQFVSQKNKKRLDDDFDLDRESTSL